MAECVTSRPTYATVGGDTSPDWSGGARSIIQYSGDFWYGWSVPVGIRGGVIGLNDVDIGTTWYELEHAIRFKGGQYKFLELGTLLQPNEPWDTYVAGDRFYIFRLGNDVIYCKRDVGTLDAVSYVDGRYPQRRFPGPIIRVSDVPSYGRVFLDCALWADGDVINDERTAALWTSYLAESAPAVDPNIPGTSHPIQYSGTIYAALPLSLAAAGDGIVSAELGAIDGELPLAITMTGTSDTGMALELPFKALAFGYPVSTYMIGDLPLSVRGGEYMVGDGNTGIVGFIPFALEARGFVGSHFIAGELSFAMAMTGSAVAGQVTTYIDGELPAPVIAATGTEEGQNLYKTFVAGELPFTALGASDEVSIFGELPLTLTATSTSSIGGINAFVQGELPMPVVVAQSSAADPNEFLIILEFTGALLVDPIFSTDITEVFYVLTPPPIANYVIRQIERVRLTSTVQTFINFTSDVQEDIAFLTTARADFILQITEQFDITDTLTITQVVKVAEALLATGQVQTFYQAVVAILSAMGASDNKITGGSSEGATAGVGVTDFGPPSVEFTFTGYWQAGTEIQLSYTTDVGPGFISYTTQIPMDAADTMVVFAAALDAHALVDAVYSGGSIQLTAQAPATTVEI